MALQRQALAGHITGTYQNPVSIGPGSVLDDAHFESAGSTGTEGFVEFEGGAVVRGVTIDGTGWRRAMSCERQITGVPTLEQLILCRDLEVGGGEKGIVGDGLVLLGKTDVHDCVEDGIFYGTSGWIFGRRGTTRRNGSTATGGQHCDCFQTLGATGNVFFLEWTILDDSPNQVVKNNSAFFHRSYVGGPPGAFYYWDCEVNFWNWAIYWFPFEAGESPNSMLDVRGCRFGTQHRTTPNGQPPILNTDAPQAVVWMNNTYGSEVYVPPVLPKPVLTRDSGIVELAQYVMAHEASL